jgi:hypothetical protein
MPWQFGKLDANLVEREPHSLGEDDKGDPSYHRAGVPAMPRIVTLRLDKSLFLIEPQG